MKMNQASNQKLSKGKSRTQDIYMRFLRNKSAIVGLFILAVFVFCALFANVICSEELVTLQDPMIRLQGPSAEHFFGTDAYGRDIFTRAVFGSRISLSVSVISVCAAVVIGGLLGAAAAYYGGRLDDLIMRAMDIIAAIPGTLLSLTLMAVLGTSLVNLTIALAVSSISGFARITRSSVLTVVSSEYVEAARACGTKDLRIISRHIIPNAMGPIIVQSTQSIASKIKTAASLSFIGLGVAPPTPEWGCMLNEAREYLYIAPHLMIFPGACIILTALAFNLIGDGLRDALDPRLRD